MSKIAVYPGTFDPITLGHVDIIERAAKLFDRLIVGVANSSRKTPCFPLAKRIEFLQKTSQLWSNVIILPMETLLVDFVRAHKATMIVRGLRVAADFDYEFQLAAMNRVLAPEIETIFLAASEKYRSISGTFVREIMELGGDISSFVPDVVWRNSN